MAANGGFFMRIGPQRRNTLEKAGVDPELEPWAIIETLLERNAQLDKLYWIFKRAQDPIIESGTLMQPDADLLNDLERRIEKHVMARQDDETNQTDEIESDPAEQTDE
jgi:hypothetical protein